MPSIRKWKETQYAIVEKKFDGRVSALAKME
jgi:hypothetical protein